MLARQCRVRCCACSWTHALVRATPALASEILTQTTPLARLHAAGAKLSYVKLYSYALQSSVERARVGACGRLRIFSAEKSENPNVLRGVHLILGSTHSRL